MFFSSQGSLVVVSFFLPFFSFSFYYFSFSRLSIIGSIHGVVGNSLLHHTTDRANLGSSSLRKKVFNTAGHGNISRRSLLIVVARYLNTLLLCIDLTRSLPPGPSIPLILRSIAPSVLHRLSQAASSTSYSNGYSGYTQAIQHLSRTVVEIL